MTVGVPIVTCLPTVYQLSKNSQNSKNYHGCTNRLMSTQSPPNTQSPHPPNTQSPNIVSKWGQHSTVGHFTFWISLSLSGERLIQKVNDPVSYYTPSSPATFVESFTTAHKTTGHGLVRFIHLTSESSARPLRFSSGRKWSVVPSDLLTSYWLLVFRVVFEIGVLQQVDRTT